MLFKSKRRRTIRRRTRRRGWDFSGVCRSSAVLAWRISSCWKAATIHLKCNNHTNAHAKEPSVNKNGSASAPDYHIWEADMLNLLADHSQELGLVARNRMPLPTLLSLAMLARLPQTHLCKRTRRLDICSLSSLSTPADAKGPIHTHVSTHSRKVLKRKWRQ